MRLPATPWKYDPTKGTIFGADGKAVLRVASGRQSTGDPLAEGIGNMAAAAPGLFGSLDWALTRLIDIRANGGYGGVTDKDIEETQMVLARARGEQP